MEQWIKINTDGSARGSPGLSTAGGVFRDHTGTVQWAFSGLIGVHTPLVAELKAVIIAIEKARIEGLRRIWLECDSTVVASLLHKHRPDVPWSIRVEWEAVLVYISSIDFHVSHIFREGNRVDDKLVYARIFAARGYLVVIFARRVSILIFR